MKFPKIKIPKIKIKTAYWKEWDTQKWKERITHISWIYAFFAAIGIADGLWNNSPNIIIINMLPFTLHIIITASYNRYRKEKENYSPVQGET